MTNLHRSLVTFVVLLAAFAGNIVLRFGLNEPPSATGDEPSYDSIAWELSQGRGFAEDFSDPEFRQPYDEAAKTQGQLMVLPNSMPGTVTHRPPLFPGILAGFDLCFGRQFFAARLFNCSLMAATGAVLFSVVDRRHGLTTAILTALMFLAVDSRTRLYSRAVLTEPLSAFLSTCLTILLWKLSRSPSIKTAGTTGVAFGLTILARSISVLWLPGLCLTLVAQLRRQSIRPTACFLCGASLVVCPWAIRNCVVLDRFMPLGAQGLMELPAGFSDEAYRRGGVWFPLDQIGFFDTVTDPTASRLQREQLRAEYGRRTAIAWISEHPLKALQLAVMKIWSEYQPRGNTEAFILILAVAGAIRMFFERECQTIMGFHFANLLSIAMTWSVEGRFMVPMLFGIHYLAAGGIAFAARSARQLSDRIRHRSDDRLPR